MLRPAQELQHIWIWSPPTSCRDEWIINWCAIASQSSVEKLIYPRPTIGISCPELSLSVGMRNESLSCCLLLSIMIDTCLFFKKEKELQKRLLLQVKTRKTKERKRSLLDDHHHHAGNLNPQPAQNLAPEEEKEHTHKREKQRSTCLTSCTVKRSGADGLAWCSL